MKDIRFRAWNETDKRMIYWFDTAFPESGNGAMLCEIPLRNADDSMFKYMMFTGLKDKYKVDIHEGDALKILEVDRNGIKEYITTVIWEDCAFLVQSGGKDYDTFLSAWAGNPNNTYPLFELEVVGNIYQNPELLTT